MYSQMAFRSGADGYVCKSENHEILKTRLRLFPKVIRFSNSSRVLKSIVMYQRYPAVRVRDEVIAARENQSRHRGCTLDQ